MHPQMAHVARTLQAAAAKARGEQEGTSMAIRLLFEEELNKYANIKLLDTVFAAFFDTNIYRGQRHTFDQILGIGSKRYFRFEHLSIPYLATTFTVDSFDRTWVNLKLVNDGFQYTPRSGRFVSPHKSDTWIELPPMEALQMFPSIIRAAKPLFKSACIYYNYAEQRVDIKLFPKEGGRTDRAMLITFEPGFPFMDDESTAGPIP